MESFTAREIDELRKDKARLDWLIANTRDGANNRWIEYGFPRGHDPREMIDGDMRPPAPIVSPPSRDAATHPRK